MVARAPALALLREQRQVAEQLALEQRPQVAEQQQRQQQHNRSSSRSGRSGRRAN